MEKLSLDGRGALQLPPRAAREIGSQSLDLLSSSPRHLWLATNSGEGPVALVGQIGGLGIADLLSFFNMFRKSGALRFELVGGVKELLFQQGEVVAATSTFPEEEFGELLYAMGKVSGEVLQRARQIATSRHPLGDVLIEQEIVTAKDLWTVSRHQVETIVFHLFTFAQGSFSFVEREIEESEAVRLSMNTQNLIMEGLRRIDERALFMRRIPSLDAVPSLTGGSEEGLNAAEVRVLELVRQGANSVNDLLRQSGVGEFDALRLIYTLIEKKLLKVEEAPQVAVDGALGELLDIFNGALGHLCKRVSAKSPGFIQEVRVFLRDLPQPFSYVFRDAPLRDDGTLDGAKVLQNLAGLGEGDKKKLLADALQELIFMECVIARRELGTGDSADLVQRVQEILRRVKILVGRGD